MLHKCIVAEEQIISKEYSESERYRKDEWWNNEYWKPMGIKRGKEKRIEDWQIDKWLFLKGILKIRKFHSVVKSSNGVPKWKVGFYSIYNKDKLFIRRWYIHFAFPNGRKWSITNIPPYEFHLRHGGKRGRKPKKMLEKALIDEWRREQVKNKIRRKRDTRKELFNKGYSSIYKQEDLLKEGLPLADIMCVEKPATERTFLRTQLWVLLLAYWRGFLKDDNRLYELWEQYITKYFRGILPSNEDDKKKAIATAYINVKDEKFNPESEPSKTSGIRESYFLQLYSHGFGSYIWKVVEEVVREKFRTKTDVSLNKKMIDKEKDEADEIVDYVSSGDINDILELDNIPIKDIAKHLEKAGNILGYGNKEGKIDWIKDNRTSFAIWQVAKKLELPRSTVYYRIKMLGIKPKYLTEEQFELLKKDKETRGFRKGIINRRVEKSGIAKESASKWVKRWKKKGLSLKEIAYKVKEL